MVNFNKTRSQGVQHFPGVGVLLLPGGGANCLFRLCDFPGGMVWTHCSPLDPRMCRIS